jgi:acyl dehydratase
VESDLTVETARLLVTEAHVAELVDRGGYTHPLFDVATHGAATPLPGQAVLLLAGGLVEQSGVLDGAVALLELKSVSFSAMVRAGEEIRVRVTPGPWRTSSSGKVLQEFTWRVISSADATVLTAGVLMMVKRPVGA